MPLTIQFELSDADLTRFKALIERARTSIGELPVEYLVRRIRHQLDETRNSDAPAFLLDRLRIVEELAEMASDSDWGLPSEERGRVLSALTYFCEPRDLIPDELPALGYIDDVIMIELVAHELRPELETYRDFCKFRQEETERRAGEEPAENGKTSVTRSDWLQAKRQELQGKMRKRRKESGGLRGLLPF